MNWSQQGGISEVFFTGDRKYAFQRVDRFWRLYGEDGNFVKEFPSFPAMVEYIRQRRADYPGTYNVCFIDGHDLKYKTFTCQAKNRKQAIEKMFDKYGPDFDHQVRDVFRED